jgi:hypothetical protein
MVAVIAPGVESRLNVWPCRTRASVPKEQTFSGPREEPEFALKIFECFIPVLRQKPEFERYREDESVGWLLRHAGIPPRSHSRVVLVVDARLAECCGGAGRRLRRQGRSHDDA